MAYFRDNVLVTVGNDNYCSPCEGESADPVTAAECYQKLQGAVNESQDLADRMRSRDRWRVFTGQDVSSDELLFLAKQAGHAITPSTSNVVVQFSQHAYQTADGRCHLIQPGTHKPGCRHCHRAMSQDNHVPLQTFLDELLRNSSQHVVVLVVLDCCRPRGEELQDPVRHHDGSTKRQVLFLYACMSDGVAYQFQDGRHGWRGYLTQALMLEMDNHYGLLDLVQAVKARVQDMQSTAGRPRLKSSRQTVHYWCHVDKLSRPNPFISRDRRITLSSAIRTCNRILLILCFLCILGLAMAMQYFRCQFQTASHRIRILEAEVVRSADCGEYGILESDCTERNCSYGVREGLPHCVYPLHERATLRQSLSFTEQRLRDAIAQVNNLNNKLYDFRDALHTCEIRLVKLNATRM